MELDNNDQADDELREIEERRAMEESGEILQPPSPRPSTPAPKKGMSGVLIFTLLPLMTKTKK